MRARALAIAIAVAVAVAVAVAGCGKSAPAGNATSTRVDDVTAAPVDEPTSAPAEHGTASDCFAYVAPPGWDVKPSTTKADLVVMNPVTFHIGAHKLMQDNVSDDLRFAPTSAIGSSSTATRS